MVATSYARRKIDVTLRLGTGGIDGTAFTTVKLTGLRVVANITKAIIPYTGLATIRVYGLTLDHINQFTVAGYSWPNSGKNHVMLEAGDDLVGMSTVFNGQIREAFPDFSAMPDTAFVIVANAGIGIQLKPVAPSSFQGNVSATDVLETIAKKCDKPLENNGVSGQLDNPYFPGTGWDQMVSCLKAVDCFGHLDDRLGVIAVCPKNGSRAGDAVVISADTGMIGYPAFERSNVMLRTLFDPEIKHLGKIKIKSQLTSANGDWVARMLDYNLSSELPGGPWEMTVTTFKSEYGG